MSIDKDALNEDLGRIDESFTHLRLAWEGLRGHLFKHSGHTDSMDAIDMHLGDLSNALKRTLALIDPEKDGTFTSIPEVPEPKFNWEKPSKAVIAANGGVGVVLFTAGPHVTSMLRDAGCSDLDNLGLDDAPDGISVWEGGIKAVHHNTPDANEHEWWLEGTFRAPTAEEWASIRAGECPWFDHDWLLDAGLSTAWGPVRAFLGADAAGLTEMQLSEAMRALARTLQNERNDLRRENERLREKIATTLAKLETP